MRKQFKLLLRRGNGKVMRKGDVFKDPAQWSLHFNVLLRTYDSRSRRNRILMSPFRLGKDRVVPANDAPTHNEVCLKSSSGTAPQSVEGNEKLLLYWLGSPPGSSP